MTTLYNICTSIDRTNTLSYRITKFVDGEVESSYLTTRTTCECPAGHRSTCRHRQMLPELINRNLLNSQLFWDFDRSFSCDINGNPQRHTQPAADEYLEDTTNRPHSVAVSTGDFDSPSEGSNPSVAATKPAPAWRRF